MTNRSSMHRMLFRYLFMICVDAMHFYLFIKNVDEYGQTYFLTVSNVRSCLSFFPLEKRIEKKKYIIVLFLLFRSNYSIH